MLELLKLVFKFRLDRSSVRECQTGKVLTPDTYTREEDKVIIAVDIDKMFDEMRDQC